jgi:hypothetical protein
LLFVLLDIFDQDQSLIHVLSHLLLLHDVEDLLGLLIIGLIRLGVRFVFKSWRGWTKGTKLVPNRELLVKYLKFLPEINVVWART